MQLSRVSRYWSVVERSQRQLVLQATIANPNFKPGWWRVVFKAKNPEALRLLQARLRIQFKQNRNFQSAGLQIEAPGKIALVFYRSSPLIIASFSFSTNTASQQDIDNARFDLAIKPITQARAWQVMLGVVSQMHYLRGEGRSRIYALTRARQKRAGWSKSLEKLVEAYQPLLSYQLVSSNPYEFWQTRNEKVHADAAAPEITPESATRFIVIEAQGPEHSHLEHRGDAHGPHGNDLSSMLDALDYPHVELLAMSTLIESQAQHPGSAFDTGTWYLLMHPLDKLAPNALHRVHQHIVEHPEAEVVYSDHDLIDNDGTRHSPNFKPDWNPELAHSQNYLGPAVWVKGTLLQQIRDISADSHLFNLQWLHALRSAQPNEPAHPGHAHTTPKLTNESKITHICEVLFHQRESNSKIRPPADKVVAALSVLAPSAQVDETETQGVFRVRYPLPSEPPMVSILVPTRDAKVLTQTCVESVLRLTDYPNYEVVILDNQSEQPDTLEWFAEISKHPQVRVVPFPAPFNYSAINNFGVQQAKGDYVCLLNNDTEAFHNDWLTNMMRHAVRPEIGCVGAKLYFFDDTIQHAGVVLGLWGLAGHGHKFFDRNDEGYQQRLVCEQSYSAVTAACLLVRKSIYQQVGGLNETELKVAFNDVDLCLKVQAAGYRNVWTPYAELYHYESKTRGKDDTPEKKSRERVEIEYMQRTWAEQIAHDPAYNPNLTRVREDFGLRIEEV